MIVCFPCLVCFLVIVVWMCDSIWALWFVFELALCVRLDWLLGVFVDYCWFGLGLFVYVGLFYFCVVC